MRDLGGEGHPTRVIRLVAEALPRYKRLRLIRALHAAGFTDREIAEATGYTTYTAARIRRSLGLEPNPAEGTAPSGSHHR